MNNVLSHFNQLIFQHTATTRNRTDMQIESMSVAIHITQRNSP